MRIGACQAGSFGRVCDSVCVYVSLTPGVEMTEKTINLKKKVRAFIEHSWFQLLFSLFAVRCPCAALGRARGLEPWGPRVGGGHVRGGLRDFLEGVL